MCTKIWASLTWSIPVFCRLIMIRALQIVTWEYQIRTGQMNGFLSLTVTCWEITTPLIKVFRLMNSDSLPIIQELGSGQGELNNSLTSLDMGEQMSSQFS